MTSFPFRGLVALFVLAWGASPAWAQTTVTFQPTRSFFWDWVIVGVLTAAALFAVCRSSRRV
jgi:hypothetical protein